MSVSELITEVVSREADVIGGVAPDDARDSVEIALLHAHLPKMEDAELVSYDRSDEMVTLTGQDDELRIHLGPTARAVVGND